MASRGARLTKLRKDVTRLQDEIARLELQNEVEELGRQLRSNPRRLRPVTDAEWKSMSIEEQRGRLADRFVTLRAEELGYSTALRKEGERGGALFQQWLASPTVQVVNLTASLTALGGLAIAGGWEVMRLLGLGGGAQDDTGDVDVTYVID